MSTSKHIDKICCVIVALTLLLSVFAVGFGVLGNLGSAESGYELKLFDDSYVHSIDIVMEDWDSFLESCENEEYAACSVVIDGEDFKNVAIRAKGNTSLSSVSSYGNNRYSFKVEFDHYEKSGYYGLDKLSLNNLIQDNTYMKDYLVYTLMRRYGVSSPLCSFVQITVNGELWGLYLAVEGVEESFLTRNYGTDYGELYKPDSMSMGGGRGNGKDFSEDAVNEPEGESITASAENTSSENTFKPQKEVQIPTDENSNSLSSEFQLQPNSSFEVPQMPENINRPDSFGGKGGMNGSSDVLLQYTDDNYDSYLNIFENAKTDITDSDKNRLIESLRILGEGNNIPECVDVEQVIRYFVVHNFVCNFDSYTGQMIHNYYLYESNGKLSMIPWDYNLAFGGFMSGADATTIVNFPVDTPVSGGSTENRPMIDWIFSNSEYTEKYHEYFSGMIAEIFENGWFAQKFDETSEMISPYVEDDPTSFCTYQEFNDGVKALREFCLLRAQSVTGQLEGTIPSTSQGQSADKSTLIQTGDLNINDMGSMGKGMGFGGNKEIFQQDNDTLSDQNNSTESAQSDNAPTKVNQSTDNENNTEPQLAQGEIPQGEMPQWQMPQGQMPPDNGMQGRFPGGGRGGFGEGLAEPPPNGEKSITEESEVTSDSQNADTTADIASQNDETFHTQENRNIISQNTDGFSNHGNRVPSDNTNLPAGDGFAGQNSTFTSENVLIVCACAVLLVFALFFAFLFKRKKTH